MKILSYEEAETVLDRRYEPGREVAAAVTEILGGVKERGDAALLDYAEKFDRVRFASLDRCRVSEAEFAAASAGIEAAHRDAIRASRENVRSFALQSLRHDWTMTNAQGAEAGERFLPFERVGLYIPGGSAPLVSTVNMTVAIAEAAGCPEIVVCTPPLPDGSLSPAMLHALEAAGATEVYKLGGVQAIGAMAYGTESIRPVQKIFGPGNAYVMEAKRQVYGAVAIDLLPGPSEILILSDGSGKPEWIAADLLAQAEHGGDSQAVLVSDSEELLHAVIAGLDLQAGSLQRQKQLTQVLETGCTLVHVETMEQGAALCNRYAPEHLTLISEREDELVRVVHTAGAIFLGNYSPVAAGDFAVGPSHELPTGGAGKCFAGLTVDQFQRRTSVVRLTKESLARTVPITDAFAEMEGLDAHGHSARVRLEGGAA